MSKRESRESTREARESKESPEFKVPPKYKFQDGEKVLCFHGPLIYEAKCLQARFDEKEKVNQYHIHYAGWNKSWDEWVPETRVLKYNETNLQKQKELHKAQKAEPKGKRGKRKSTTGKESPSVHIDKDGDSRSSTPTVERGRQSSASSSQDSSSDVPRRKRSKIDPTVESEEQFLSKVEIKIKLPDQLKPILVDDWEWVTKQKRLVKIPTRHTVETLLDEYSLQRVKAPIIAKEEARIEVTDGIREYFNVMLGSQLLYKPERKQFNEIMRENPEKQPSEIYGAIHLLRLFVKIGCALAYTRLDERTIQLLVLHLNDFLKFLQKNYNTYFSQQDYSAPVV